MSDAQANEAERNIEIWKVKKLIKRLEAARGNGTSMISLIIPPKDQVSRAAKMLAEEYGTASNIKSRVNRQSVLSAITSTQQRLKLYNKVPPNGLVIYCGEILTQEGKERKVNIDFEPFKPINTSLYLCDNKFHTEALAELLESDQKFGFIIMDGNGALFGTLSGNTRDIVHKFSVDLPKKHGRGGQSALRFARLREEKRHNYVRKVAELAVQNFITNDKVNVAGIILAGSADFKNDLNASDMFDNRLQSKVIKVVDVSYGGENGFNQAIELSSETLGNVKFIQEKKLIGKYFEEISQDTGKVCYGIEDTLKALELGAVETLIVFENLEITRWTLKDSEGTEIVLHTTKQQEQNRDQFQDKHTGQEMDIVSQESFLEWIAEHYKDFGTALEFVSDRSTEGNQFVKGFGGIGGILRYKVNFEQLADLDDDDDYYDADSLVDNEGPAQVQPSVHDEEGERRDSAGSAEAAPMSFAEKRLKRRTEAAESRTKGHEASRPSPLRSMMTAT
ncbi:translation termination factor eRF1 [Purpureocillium takamizusanense]|uniref:Translation termination factor eRF1 n=1 Tax=Purpureocillium takamizusanense TaxID=2060973 RepID=A0A9Q8Q7B1_9HYPO|nr:translation termination factor eRF1 [Purpureocillium takamizusanense]UNI14400.1 translation termination factor eRF1 [Purpureocillium takamizusanense]